MTEPQAPPVDGAATAAAARPPADAALLPGRWIAAAALLLGALCAAALVLAWNTQQRVKGLEQQLVKRQEDSAAQAAEAQMLARQAQDSSRDAAAKLALLDVRVAEVALQRTQLEELIQAVSRSRDESLLDDVESSIRLGMQQTAITGSAEPLVIALKQAEERLARQQQPRLESVRRAVAQDLERVRAAGGVDVSALAMRLDEVVRLVDELPLLSAAQPPRSAARSGGRTASAAAPASAAASAPVDPAWTAVLGERWAQLGARIWSEVRGLVRVTPIDRPEAMLVSPEQAYFLRENLKLRLLNARLALLSRQFDTAQADLRDALSALERYFDRQSRRTASAIDLVKQVASQARQVVVPRPDATLAALAAAASGR